MMDWEIAKPLLEAKLDPAHVRKPSGSFGPKGDYIEGWHAIAEANRIFGFGGWSYTIKTMTQDSLKEGKTAKGDVQWQAAYTCIVTVTVGDVVREDVGFGSGFAKQIGDAVEGATKEAVTDALKRALRTFGNAFGLALYDKSRENVGAPPIPFDAAKTRDRIKAAIVAAADQAKLDALWSHHATKDAVSKLTEAMQSELQAAYSNRMGEVA
ncbi:RAD52 family DNA repair protein [Loktanella sp. R86503]|uniref:RAD52 family DNA repair protein n=1 Tax=Loktanella sp. R86503 TaxID=3093847 RepID=UPI0036DC2019